MHLLSNQTFPSKKEKVTKLCFLRIQSNQTYSHKFRPIDTNIVLYMQGSVSKLQILRLNDHTLA